ncbi:MAG: non-canonical purine NTP pyrophosphatase [Candidatus Cryosericum sp.]
MLVTANSHKESEVSSILHLLRCDLDLEHVEATGTVECGVTYYQNAYRKAVAGRATRAAKGPSHDVVFADDSGIELPELGGIPGVRSARFEYQGLSERAALTKLLLDRGIVSTPARFICWVVAFVPWTTVCLACTGVVDGTVTAYPRGSGGFGYDPMFVPCGYGLTFSEMAPALKDGMSHRARAVKELWSRVQEGTGLRP